MTPATLPRRLADLPLWRLLVLMDDTERTIGPDSETARVLADAIRDRLRAERGEQPAGEEVGRE